MKRVDRVLGAVDGFQKAHPALGFPLAVIKKYGDDQTGNLAALLAWYALASVFPLLLVLVTVLGIVLRGDPGLQASVLHSTFVHFPIIGTQLHNNIHSLNRAGFGLAVGLVGTFIGARGIANAAQNAFNSIWEVPYKQRPGFPKNLLRSVALVLIVGVGIIVTTALSGLGGGSGTFGVGLRVGAVAVAFVLNVGLFLLAFRLATAPEVATRDLRLGALLTAVVWQVLQWLGAFLVARYLKHASEVYGLFGLVLGLMSWMYIQAQLTLYAVQIDVVRTRRLWPRTFLGPARTGTDEAALTSYGKVEERTAEETVDVGFQ
ncbi:MAG TPA: YihY/virulence factor BrkB family protein [Mycobacteriales bacterium]|nr:YihY/virulence factor BrkB family protein [Mycobacteriales bacterium]